MAQQDLSPQAQSAITTLQELPPTEQATVVRIIIGHLAQRIWRAVKTATPTQLARAFAHVVERGEAALAQGFREVTAPDDTKAIEVKITRPGGEEVTCLLSEGARGKCGQNLVDYGRDELQGVTLLSRDDLEVVVKSLYEAIEGLTVANDGALQTEDAALKKAYQIAREGVRSTGGFSWVVFTVDERGGYVAGCCIHDLDGFCDDFNPGDRCALFGAGPAESK